MAAPKPRISCFVAEESRTIVAADCPAGIHEGASDWACRWPPTVLQIRTDGAPSAQARTLPERDNAAVVAVAVLRKLRRECLAIQAPCSVPADWVFVRGGACGISKICRKHHI